MLQRDVQPKLGRSVQRAKVRDLLTVGISKQDRNVALISILGSLMDGDGMLAYGDC